MKAKVPTAPDIFPQAIASRARMSRSRFLAISSIPQGHLEAEGDRFGMDAVGPADHQGLLVPEGLFFQDGQQLVDVGQEDVRGLFQKHGQGGVEDVRGREPHVDETGIGPYEFRHAGEEGDYVVLDGPLDLVDAVDVETRLLLDRPERLSGDVPLLRQSLTGEDLDVQPLLESVLRAPDGLHFLARISRDHDASVMG